MSTSATSGRGQPWFRRWWPVPVPDRAATDPASDSAAAAERLAKLSALDDERIDSATRSRVVAPAGTPIATVICWHGFTNAPSQFSVVASLLSAAGYRVVLPRMPYHGYRDRLSRDLGRLSAKELSNHVDLVVDMAAGWKEPVWVLGLSAGAVLAAWAAALREEVSRLVLIAPLVAPKAIPRPLVRLLASRPGLVPAGAYLWWDPRRKADLDHSPYAYPGFPLRGLLPFLQLSESLFDHAVEVGHDLDRVVLVNNPKDLAVRLDAARELGAGVFAPRAGYYAEATVDPGLAWMHDFVDPWSPGAGTPEQVLAVLLAALGEDDPSAGGLLVPPLVQAQPAGG